MTRYANHQFDRILYERLVHYISVRQNVGLRKFRRGLVGRPTAYSYDVMRCSYGSK